MNAEYVQSRRAARRALSLGIRSYAAGAALLVFAIVTVSAWGSVSGAWATAIAILLHGSALGTLLFGHFSMRRWARHEEAADAAMGGFARGGV